MSLISTISFSNEEILRNIIELYVPSRRIELDPTYSKGNFYKTNVIDEPILKFDIFPQREEVVQADCRNLPLKDCSVSSIVFDPPFLATKGKSLVVDSSANIIARRFSVFPTEKELHRFYVESLKELHRVLKDDGILIFKCQDKVSSGKQYFSHVFICNEAERIGFSAVDLFVLLAKTRLVAAWQRKQRHARKFHCYYWVFKKNGKCVEYV